MRKYLLALLTLSGVLAVASAGAADPTPATVPESPWRLGVALGYGERSNPLALSDDVTILIDHDVAWFGRRWFFDNGDLGITLIDHDAYTVNFIGRLNSDRLFFSKTDTEFVSVFGADGVVVTERIEVPDRDYAVELGLELLADGDWGYTQAAAHRDISNTHDGYEVYVNYGRAFRTRRWAFEPSLGLSWKSEKLNDYYWGVHESEANSMFAPYRAGSGLNSHARFLTSYQINRRWAYVAVAEYERINRDAAASPIVEDRQVLSVFTGFKVGF